MFIVTFHGITIYTTTTIYFCPFICVWNEHFRMRHFDKLMFKMPHYRIIYLNAFRFVVIIKVVTVCTCRRMEHHLNGIRYFVFLLSVNAYQTSSAAYIPVCVGERKMIRFNDIHGFTFIINTASSYTYRKRCRFISFICTKSRYNV